MGELPPFELRPVCPKCGGDAWAWRFLGFIIETLTILNPPRLRLTCDRCGYTFDMATKDAADAG